MATPDHRIRSYLDGEVALAIPIPDTLASTRAAFPACVHAQATLTACSLCLRASRGGEWVDAETVIRELRSFEHAAPPKFEAALCPACAVAIQLRRAPARAQRRRAGAPPGEGR